MPTGKQLGRPIEILLVEDSQSDAGLTKIALEEAEISNRLHHVTDGIEAMAFLRGEGEFANVPRPDVILLDLNMPRMGGLDVLRKLRNDDTLKRIPVIVLTTSHFEQDIAMAYDLNAKAYLRKPVEFADFISIMKAFDAFWLSSVTLPPQAS